MTLVPSRGYTTFKISPISCADVSAQVKKEKKAMASQDQVSTKGNRLHWMDNLRTIVILLVVLYHAGGVYSFLFASFWIVADPATSDLVAVLLTIFDLTVMPIIFLISGYLIPVSLKNKSGWAFLKSRFRRLIVPWIIAVLTVIPLYKVIFLYSRGLPQEHWTTYFHFSNDWMSQLWLWFLPVLFLFNLLYMLLAKANIRIPNISLKVAILGIFVIGVVYGVGMRVMTGYRTWTKTPLIDFENERLLLYFMMFLLGALCYRQKVFAGKPQNKTLYIVISSTVWIPIFAHQFARMILFIFPGGVWVSPLVDTLIWWITFYLSMACMVYLLIESFRRYVDKTGRIWNELNRNSYGVYVIHVIVVGVIALPLRNSSMPSLLKYVILSVSTYVVSNLIVSLYRRAVTGIKAASQPKTSASVQPQ
jgi:peptidoglycan/LPS O-acetylase OafA/YrhL